MNPVRATRRGMTAVRLSAVALALLLAVGSEMLPAFAATTVTVSQVPLALATTNRPQVLIAVGNSQSMDGTLSGAIMTGSGSLSSDANTLGASSSPATYVVPSGFTPPVQATDAAGNAPYSVSVSGQIQDNGASRLNVAKGGIQAILAAYMQNTDFALATYTVTSIQKYSTSVYYMSPTNANFSFTNTPVSTNRYVTNPCQNYSTASSTVKSNCTAIAGLLGTAVSSSTYMQIGASSDDTSINDVLYLPSGGSYPAVFVDSGTVTPANPFPPNYSLADYNGGSNVLITYSSVTPSNGIRQTGPTNAGYVPYSKQVMYSQRGFGYYGSQSANTGTIAVPMTTSGATPTTASVTTAINTFLPYLKPETDNASTTEIKAAAVQAPTAGLLTRAKTYLASAATSTGGCAQKQYVVLISDGLPTQDLAGKLWPPLGSASAAGYGVTATFNTDGTLATSNNQAVKDTITTLTALNNAGIKTYVIGLGAGVDSTVNPQAASTLQAMAIAGGTVSYYPASSPTALVNGLNSILVSVQNGSMSTTASAVNSTKLQSGSVEYQGEYTSSDSPYQDWTGDFYAKAIDPTTGSPTGGELWSAQALLDAKAPGSRVIGTWNPALASGAGAGAGFQWTNSNPVLAISAAQQTLLQPSDTLGQSRLAYLRGDTSLEKRNGGTFRNRSHRLGDIVSSQAAYVGTPNGSYLSSSYTSFQSTWATRQAMLYVGANDGMLHAFNASTGAEQFAFIPNGVFANLYNLTAPLYNNSHLFFVDGSPQVGDVQFSDSSWHTILVGGENGGGKTVFALDVTNPAAITTEAVLASKVLWEFSDSGMGLSYSAPRIAKVTATPGYAVFFGNGYNSTINHSILYAVNPQTGATLAKIDLCTAAGVPAGTCSATAAQGLSTVAVGNSDGLQGQPITQVYAGDLQGNLWAVDVSSATPANWTVRLLFRARDASGVAQSITTAPVITLNPNYPRQAGLFVMFGTGQFLATTDLANQQTQSVYGVWDKPGATGGFLRADLTAQTLTRVAATGTLAQDILTATSNVVNFATKLGWYADLPTAGQRVITESTLLNGMFITTLNTPPTAACGTPGIPMLLELNYATGGASAQPVLDINADGLINSSDTYNSKNAVGVGLGTSGGYASSPTILGPTTPDPDGDPPIPGPGPGFYAKNITLQSGQQLTKYNPNNGARSTSWWQLTIQPQ